MRKIFNSAALLCLAASLWIGGCGKSAEVASTQTYTIYKQKVQLTPPKDWKVRQEPSPDDKNQTAAVVFDPPTGWGHIAITVTEGVKQDKEFMNQLANGIKPFGGSIVKQWYEHKLDDADKENAYFMEYKLDDAGPSHPKQKGMQVQIFTTEKVLYSLVFTAEPEVYDAHRETFVALAKSFDRAK